METEINPHRNCIFCKNRPVENITVTACCGFAICETCSKSTELCLCGKKVEVYETDQFTKWVENMESFINNKMSALADRFPKIYFEKEGTRIHCSECGPSGKKIAILRNIENMKKIFKDHCRTVHRTEIEFIQIWYNGRRLKFN